MIVLAVDFGAGSVDLVAWPVAEVDVFVVVGGEVEVFGDGFVMRDDAPIMVERDGVGFHGAGPGLSAAAMLAVRRALRVMVESQDLLHRGVSRGEGKNDGSEPRPVD